MVIQFALLVASHAQPDGAVTDADPVPPAEPKFWVEGETWNEQATPGVTITVKVGVF